MAKRGKYKKRKILRYKKEDMSAAVAAVISKKVTCYTAARVFNVPYSTLSLRVKQAEEAEKSAMNIVKSGTKLSQKGSNTVEDNDYENRYGKRRKHVKKIDISQIKMDFVDECDKWFHAEKDPSCKSKAADALSKAIRLYEGDDKEGSQKNLTNIDIQIGGQDDIDDE